MSNGTVPSNDNQLLVWLNQHAPVWATNRANIGLSQAYTNAFTSANDDAQKSWAEWQSAKEAARAASEAWRIAKAAARTKAAEGVRTIRNFAESGGVDPTVVYTTAEIPAPKAPTQGVPPGQPTAVRVSLDVNTGNLKLSFKCDNPKGTSGTVYTVSRRNNSTSPWQTVGLVSTKAFTDTSLVAGTASVQYQITAQRGGIIGSPSIPVTVSFGHAAGTGETVATIKLAA